MKVPYFSPWVTEQDKKYVINAMSQRWLTNGKYLKKFEQKFSNFIGSDYSIGVSNATQALHLSVKSLGIGENDEIIVPTFTFAATSNAVSYCNAKPVLVDIDPATFNISPMTIEKKITKRTKGIIVVHYGGQACDMEEILLIAKNHGLFIIEDCAHALGSTYKNQMCGNIGITGCFSFYPTKIITTGEGGMISTSDSEIYKKTTLLRSQAMNVQANEREKKAKWQYDVTDLGYNYRLDEIRASLGYSQLKRISKINKLRINVAKKYNSKISKIKGLSIPETKPNRNHIYHLYTIKIEKEYHLTRDQLFEKLSKKGIGTSVQYYPLHLMKYNKNKYEQDDFPYANLLKDKILCLPIYPTMTDKQIEYVLSNLA